MALAFACNFCLRWVFCLSSFGLKLYEVEEVLLYVGVARILFGFGFEVFDPSVVLLCQWREFSVLFYNQPHLFEYVFRYDHGHLFCHFRIDFLLHFL